MPFGLLCRGAWGSAYVWRLLLNSNPNSCCSAEHLPFPQLASYVLFLPSSQASVYFQAGAQHEPTTSTRDRLLPTRLLNIMRLYNWFTLANLCSRKCNTGWIIFFVSLTGKCNCNWISRQTAIVKCLYSKYLQNTLGIFFLLSSKLAEQFICLCLGMSKFSG